MIANLPLLLISELPLLLGRVCQFLMKLCIFLHAELAQNYKEEGIHHFKYKRYRPAVASFSEGLRSKCTDSELLAQLLNNRAAAYYRLGKG